MPRYCKVYMNEESIENQKDLKTGLETGLYAWGRVIRENQDGKVLLVPTHKEFDINRANVLIRERSDVTWDDDPIIKKRIINKIEDGE